MSFAKGVMIGTLITAGTLMMYSEGLDQNKKKVMKKGKQLVKRMKNVMEKRANKPFSYYSSSFSKNVFGG